MEKNACKCDFLYIVQILSMVMSITVVSFSKTTVNSVYICLFTFVSTITDANIKCRYV